MLNLEPYIPLVTAALTLANTVVLFMINRRTSRTHERVNGLLLQHTVEAEQRGRRLAAHDLVEAPFTTTSAPSASTLPDG